METKEKLELLGKQLAEDILKGKSPTFRTRVRSRSNIILDKGTLTLGEKWEERTFANISQAKTFMQTIAVASKLKSFLEQGLHTSIRGLFYQLKFSLGEDLDENLFDEQSESNALVEDLEASLGVKREDFNLTTDRKGVLAGPIKIIDRFGGEEVIIDGTKMGRSGWMIPSDVDNDMEIKEIDANYVLVVEKDALWQRLNEDRFWEKEKALLITPKGQSSRGTRRLLRKLADAGLPIYVFSVEGNAWIPIYKENRIYIKQIKTLLKDPITDGFAKRAHTDYSSEGIKADGSVEKAHISQVIEHKHNGRILELRSDIGHTLKLTENHSVIVFNSRMFTIAKKMPDEITNWDYGLVRLLPNIETISEYLGISLDKKHMILIALSWVSKISNKRELRKLLETYNIPYRTKGRFIYIDKLKLPEWDDFILNAPNKEAFISAYLLAKGERRYGGVTININSEKEKIIITTLLNQLDIKYNMAEDQLTLETTFKSISLFKFPKVTFPIKFFKSVELLFKMKYKRDIKKFKNISLTDFAKFLQSQKISKTYCLLEECVQGISPAMRKRARDKLISLKLLTRSGKPTNKAISLIKRLKLLENMILSRVVPVKLRVVRNYKKQMSVYDISLPGIGTFFANHIAVHNTDCDAWGWYIYWTLKTGSINLAYLGKEFTVPEAKFIGVTMSDIEKYPFLKKLTIKAKEVDIKRAQEMLDYEWINRYPEWVKELELVLKTKRKLEQDALQGQRLTFVGEYVKDKIKNQEFLP